MMAGDIVIDRRATIEEQDAYETLRIRLREVEMLMHPAKAGVVDLKALAFIVEALKAVDAGERMPGKPNVPPVAKPGRGRGWKPRAGSLDDDEEEVEKPRNDEDEGDGA